MIVRRFLPLSGSSPTIIAITPASIVAAGQAVVVNSSRILSVTTASMAFAGQAVATVKATTIAITNAVMNYAGVTVQGSVPIIVAAGRWLGLGLGLRGRS